MKESEHNRISSQKGTCSNSACYICCAMRGRKETPDSPYEQHLELNSSEWANSLTTATKDCLIMEVTDA